MADGNIAAMREALDDIIDKIDTWRSDGTIEHWQYSQLFDIADAALAAPVRNCDVGTAEEQCLRFWRETEREPEIARSVGGFSRWAQMPYEEGGAE